MEFFLYMIAKVVSVYLSVAALAMFLRVILQLFVAEDNKFLIICFMISEPFIMPFRFILSKFGIGQNSPLDISFFVAYLALMLLQLFLPVI